MEWRPVEGFENYEVSYTGQVRNLKRGSILKSYGQRDGHAKVQLVENGKYYTRSLAKIVATAWVEDRLYESCDTPINLNGDRMDCHAANLAWRPLWYARKFNHQRKNPRYPNWDRRFYCQETNEEFDTLYECAGAHGILEEDIYDSLRTGCRAYLIGYRYFYI